MKAITARQAYRKFGGIDELCRILSVRYGILIGAEKSENPDDPRDNALIVSFEFPDDKKDRFLTAREALIDSFLRAGLMIEHECNGDGETGVIFAYRVMAVDKGC